MTASVWISACGFTPAKSYTPSKPTPTAPSQAVLWQDTLLWNGRPLVLRQNLETWKQILGPSPRHVDRAGGMWIWDSLGVLVKARYSDSSATRHVAACWFVFQKRDVDFWPHTAFAGTVSIRNASSSHSAASAVNPALSREAWIQSKSPWFQAFPDLTPFARLQFTGQASKDSLQALLFQVYPW